MAKQTRKVNTIKNGTIELVLLLLLQTNKKYGYQLAQEMSELSMAIWILNKLKLAFVGHVFTILSRKVAD